MTDIGAFLNQHCGHDVDQIGEAMFFVIGSWYNEEGIIEKRVFDPYGFSMHMGENLFASLGIAWDDLVSKELRSNLTTLYQFKFELDEQGNYILCLLEKNWSIDDCHQHLKLFMQALWSTSLQSVTCPNLPWADIAAHPASLLRAEILAPLEAKHISIESLADFAKAEIGPVDALAQVIIAFQTMHSGQLIWLDTGAKVHKWDEQPDQLSNNSGGIRIEDLACLSKQPTYLSSPSCNRVVSSSATLLNSPG
uniref:Uncharacterized protein n=1 Tax=Moniliophthora roreri TaxID=221103 RepID=A0A0W0FXR0_MONRR